MFNILATDPDFAKTAPEDEYPTLAKGALAKGAHQVQPSSGFVRSTPKKNQKERRKQKQEDAALLAQVAARTAMQEEEDAKKSKQLAAFTRQQQDQRDAVERQDREDRQRDRWDRQLNKDIYTAINGNLEVMEMLMIRHPQKHRVFIRKHPENWDYHDGIPHFFRDGQLLPLDQVVAKAAAGGTFASIFK